MKQRLPEAKERGEDDNFWLEACKSYLDEIRSGEEEDVYAELLEK